MKKYLGFFWLFIFMLSSAVFPLAQEDFVIKSRLFKSMGKETNQESDVVISIFSVPVLIPFHPSYIQLEKISIYRLKRELQKIYKIEDIDHLASGIMLWDGRKSQYPRRSRSSSISNQRATHPKKKRKSEKILLD